MKYKYTDADRSRDFKFFLSHYDELYKKYGHKYIVIRNQNILNVYDTLIDALHKTEKRYPIGTFIVQECNGDETAYTDYISSTWDLAGV